MRQPTSSSARAAREYARPTTEWFSWHAEHRVDFGLPLPAQVRFSAQPVLPLESIPDYNHRAGELVWRFPQPPGHDLGRKPPAGFQLVRSQNKRPLRLAPKDPYELHAGLRTCLDF